MSSLILCGASFLSNFCSGSILIENLLTRKMKREQFAMTQKRKTTILRVTPMNRPTRPKNKLMSKSKVKFIEIVFYDYKESVPIRRRFISAGYDGKHDILRRSPLEIGDNAFCTFVDRLWTIIIVGFCTTIIFTSYTWLLSRNFR